MRRVYRVLRPRKQPHLEFTHEYLCFDADWYYLFREVCGVTDAYHATYAGYDYAAIGRLLEEAGYSWTDLEDVPASAPAAIAAIIAHDLVAV